MKPLAVPSMQKNPATAYFQQFLVFCGILSSLLYVIMNIACAMLYQGYNAASQTVSELSAIGAPTRQLWVTCGIVYGILLIAFGWGVWQSGSTNRRLRIVGALFMIDAFIGFFWPPMHTREVLAAGGGTIDDVLHIVWTYVHIPLVMLSIGFGASAFGKKFQLYSIATLVILIVTGFITGMDGPNVSKNLPTPWVGVWERILIGVYMAWIVVMAIILLRGKNKQAE